MTSATAASAAAPIAIQPALLNVEAAFRRENLSQTSLSRFAESCYRLKMTEYSAVLLLVFSSPGTGSRLTFSVVTAANVRFVKLRNVTTFVWLLLIRSIACDFLIGGSCWSVSFT